MPIKISYTKNTSKKSNSNLILFCNEKLNLISLKKNLSNSEYSYISELIKKKQSKQNLFLFEINARKKIILVSIKNNLKISDIESLGAEFYKKINYGKGSEHFLISDSVISNHKDFLGHFLHGVKLKSYEFTKYKSKK